MPQFYVIERVVWSCVQHKEVLMRLRYERTYLPERQMYRDFLVSKQEL